MARSDRPSRPSTARVHKPSLRASTRRAIQPSGPPTDEIPLWTAPDGVERKTAQAVIDLAMRAGVAMLATGAAAADVTATVLMLTRAYGLKSVHVDVTYTSVTVSYHRGPDADPVTVMRVVRYRVQDTPRSSASAVSSSSSPRSRSPQGDGASGAPRHGRDHRREDGRERRGRPYGATPSGLTGMVRL